MSYGFHIKAEGTSFNTIIGGFDLCRIIEKLNLELNSCYTDWEIVKRWRLK